MTGKFISVYGLIDTLRRIPDCSVWTPQGCGDVPVGNHCEAVENTTCEDVKPGFAAGWYQITSVTTEHEKPYIVETDAQACGHCQKGATYAVAGPDGEGGLIRESTSYEQINDAEDVAEAMNRAYKIGRKTPRKEDFGTAMDA